MVKHERMVISNVLKNAAAGVQRCDIPPPVMYQMMVLFWPGHGPGIPGIGHLRGNCLAGWGGGGKVGDRIQVGVS